MSADPRPSPAPTDALAYAFRHASGNSFQIAQETATRIAEDMIGRLAKDGFEIVEAASRPLPAAGLEVDHALKRLEKLIDSPYAGGLQDFMQRAAVRVRELRVVVDRLPAAGQWPPTLSYETERGEDAPPEGLSREDYDRLHADHTIDCAARDWSGEPKECTCGAKAINAELARLASAPNREDDDG